MKVSETALDEVLLFEPRVFGDERGFFLESYQEERYRSYGLPAGFVQDNHSRSRGGVLRGLHYQLTHPQGKLVRVTQGVVFDVAVDVRRGSPQFGDWVGLILSDTNHRQLWVPPGFAHGFCVLSASADFQYKCTDYYQPDDERGLLWSDPTIGIEWPLSAPAISDKDAAFPRLDQVSASDLPEYEA